MTVRCAGAIPFVLLTVAFGAGGPESQEAKAVKEMYGPKIAAAKATPTEDDDVALAKEMVQAAADSGSSDKLRYALARTALDLGQTLTSDAGLEQARRALEIADGIHPLAPEDKAAIRRDLAARQLAYAKAKKPNEVQALARAAAEAHLAYVNVLLNDPAKAREVESSLGAVRGLVGTHRLTDLKESLDSATETFTQAKTRRARLSAAEARLKEAQEGGEPSAIQVAGHALAQVYLECDGDLATAAKYLAGAQDPRDKMIVAAAAFLADPNRLDPATCLEVIDALVKLAPPLGELPRVRIADCAMRMCQAFLAGNPPEIAAAKARLLMIQMQAILGQTPADQLRKKLELAYKGFRGKLEILEGARIRATYDFSDEKQLKDWDVTRGEWKVQKDALVLDPQNRMTGEIGSKLRFRADRPFRVSFVGVSDRELTAEALFYAAGMRSFRHLNTFSLRSGSGLSMSVFGEGWNDDRAQLKEGAPYRFDISFDGKTQATWSVNSAVVREQRLNADSAAELANGSFALRLRTRSLRAVSAFGNVVMEGEVVLPEPAAAPVAPTVPPAGTSRPVVRPAPPSGSR